MLLEHIAVNLAGWWVHQVVKWHRGERNLIIWGTSLKYIMPPSLWACIHVEDAGDYEYLYQREGILLTEVALFLWPGKPVSLKEAVAAAGQLSHWVVPPVLWQGVVAHELDSSISTEGIDLPEEITRTVITDGEIQESSCWTVVLISVWYSTFIWRLGLQFSFRGESVSVFLHNVLSRHIFVQWKHCGKPV